MSRLVGPLLAALLGCGCALAWAEASVEIVRASVGFGGQYKLGSLAPVDVAIRGGDLPLDGMLSLIVPDGDAVDVRYAPSDQEPIRLTPGQQTVVRRYVRFGQATASVTAEFSVAGRILCRRRFSTDDAAHGGLPTPCEPQHRIYLVVGADDCLGLEELVRSASPDEPAEASAVRIDDAAQLPDRWFGYEGVEAVVLCGKRLEAYRLFTPGSARNEALQQWVRQGGRLVVCVGADGERLLRGDGPLASFAPGAWQKTVGLGQATALEAYAEAVQPAPGVEPGKELPAAKLDLREGLVEARDGDLPLVVRFARGFGQIAFLAVDLDRPPLGGWIARLPLLERLLGVAAEVKTAAKPSPLPASPYGVVDLTGQLNKALGEFSGVRMVPFWVVAAAIVAYLLIVGPLDYLFLRRVAGRMVFTWVTFPLAAAAVSGAAYLAAFQLKGTQVRLNQAEIIDVDAADRMVRGTAWANLFSPRLDVYDLSLRPAAAAWSSESRTMLSWLGQSGGALGGMSNRAALLPFAGRDYVCAPAFDRLENVPIQSWATKSFLAQWQARAAAVPEATLVDEGPLLSGRVVNRLEKPLRNAALLYRHWAHELGDLVPGQSAPLGAAVRRSQLTAYLLGEKVVREAENKFVQQTTPYDPAGDEAVTILRAMMFYRAAGGIRYARLQHGSQAWLDMSGLLAAGRAVLVAEVDLAGVDLLRDAAPLAADRRTTFVRFVFPVDRRDASDQRKPLP